MIRIGLIRESKIPADNRVALIPSQCKWLQKNFPDLRITVQSSQHRCFSDKEYLSAGIEVKENMGDCDILFGIKEVPMQELIPEKIYLFFSHTKKRQLYNQQLFRAMIDKKITLMDYECMEHEDGQRILGFGFFAGVVGAHNGIMAYGQRTGEYHLERVYKQ
jgi:saccharopine dehydrogenase (NAD+, L-lysine-forming)